MKIEDLEVGQTVYVHIAPEFDRMGCDRNGWLEVEVSTVIGIDKQNPGRELVEVHSPWLECGWGMFDSWDLYPAPDFNTTYRMVEIVERIPDERTYEFGIGDIGNVDDSYYTATQETKPTGKRKMVLLKKCDGCGGEFPREWMMNASAGLACPDCYDRMSE